MIDEAVIPALVLLISKVVAVFFLIQWFNLSWKFDTVSVVPNVVFENPEVTLFVSAISTLVMFVVAVVGLLWVLVRAYHLHDTHISPSLVLSLLSWNMSWVIGTSHELYHQGIVWLSYIWLITLMVAVHAFIGLSYVWELLAMLMVSAAVTWLFIADVERELQVTT